MEKLISESLPLGRELTEMSNRQHYVRTLPSGLKIQVCEEETLLEALSKNGISIDSICGGKGLCGKCGVKIIRGLTSPTTEQEERWKKIIGSDKRLACQVRILSDAEIELNQLAKASKTKILTWAQEVNVPLEPSTTRRHITLKKPSLEDQRADLERLIEGLKTDIYDSTILSKISERLWASDFDVDCILFEDELIDICPHSSQPNLYGIAFDIGTTTVVGYLYDLMTGTLLAVKSHYNEQIRFGEDVISRVEFASKSKENLLQIQAAIVHTMNKIIEELLEAKNIRQDSVYDIVCAGNTVMTSILLGNSGYYLSRAPYVPPFTGPTETKLRDLKVLANGRGYLRTLPAISAYVGGDLVADILVSEIYKYEEPVALVDLGTNGEVVVKTERSFLASSCAAGPALEGYSIRNGMRAMEGAIESVSISGDDVFLKTIGDVKPIGICGSGIVEALAWMKIKNIIDESGKIVEGSSKRVIHENGELQYVLFDDGKDNRIAVTQSDVRKLQLAKAAVFSTFTTLTKLSNIKISDLRRLFVAGAFGTYVEPFYATVIGLLPELPRPNYIQIGNGSGAGASFLLLSKSGWKEAVKISNKVKVVELNLVKFFKDEFLNATYIPHKDESLFKTTMKSIEPLAKT
ncbi:MAG: ASKHA domain-containing protein [Nitrososphaeria archaeon]